VPKLPLIYFGNRIQYSDRQPEVPAMVLSLAYFPGLHRFEMLHSFVRTARAQERTFDTWKVVR
jgi:hypothetical protein